MTIRAMNWAWGIELPPATKLVLLKLADRANDDGECWPGMASVASQCCISERTLMRHLDALEEIGLLQKSKRKDDSGRQMPNVYTLNLEYQPGDKLSPGDDEPGDKPGESRVTTVSPDKELKLFIEPTDINHKHAQECARHPVEQIAADPVRFDGVSWTVDDAVFDSWLVAYQNGRTYQDTEDWIEAELEKASVWMRANPRKAARKKKLLQFLAGWLTRAMSSTQYHRGKPQPRPYH